MESDLGNMKIEDIKIKLDEMKLKLQNISEKWTPKNASSGLCDECYGDERDKEKPVIDLGDRKYCKEHYSDYKIRGAKEELEKEIKEFSAELKFRELIETATKTSQIKDIIVAVKAAIKRENKKSYSDKSTITEQDKENARRLLRLLKKLRPKSSIFIDRGVAINEDLFLSGTITDRGNRYGSRPKNKITLTALDQDEHYKSIARVRLTIQQAERLRNLLVDVIEHVRIYSLIDQIGSTMGITIKEDENDLFDEEEDD